MRAVALLVALMDADRVRKVYNSGRVERFHTLADYSGARRQNIAEHSWGVAVIVLMLCEIRGTPPSMELLRAALLHDAEESITGDIPSPTKWRFRKMLEGFETVVAEAREELGLSGLYGALSEDDLLLLYWADALEMFVYTAARANELAYREVFERIKTYILTELPPSESGLILMKRMLS